jgi:hypothetical protein
MKKTVNCDKCHEGNIQISEMERNFKLFFEIMNFKSKLKIKFERLFYRKRKAALTNWAHSFNSVMDNKIKRLQKINGSRCIFRKHGITRHIGVKN